MFPCHESSRNISLKLLCEDLKSLAADFQSLLDAYSYFKPHFQGHSSPTEQSLSLIIFVSFAVVRTDSPLAKLYTTSTLEHHHFNHAVIILSTEVSVSLALQVLHTTETKIWYGVRLMLVTFI